MLDTPRVAAREPLGLGMAEAPSGFAVPSFLPDPRHPIVKQPACPEPRCVGLLAGPGARSPGTAVVDAVRALRRRPVAAMDGTHLDP
ncbi:MAG: hypothetical protein AVDCRST_MAG34-1782 [uncultured Nocardioidaceae bacterium]|uniref:Uncharacterized protein n=1 Tax=uncultured Nocardioidaceae bacterium TaxID=253824 RepID=A0A6J4M689_9ACTN|nr:MAG: hypothetical protein AVDCRST_MAG34-1782 [uncultured Nocardioidaceae bacterium]